MLKLNSGIAPEHAREVLLARVDEVLNCRVHGAGPGPRQHLQFADQYLRWVEDTELHFRRLFEGDDWLHALHTRRWEQIVNMGRYTQRPAGLINAEIDHQAARLTALADRVLTASTQPAPEAAASQNSTYVHSLNDLHPQIQAASAGLFQDGHYAEAILRAFIAVEVAVRERSGLDLSGTTLVNHAMGTPTPVLTMTAEQGQTGRDEQNGMRSLFAGAMLGIRNPKAHGLVDQADEPRAFEYLAFASLLMRRLDDATST